jgi:hypothetical protein
MSDYQYMPPEDLYKSLSETVEQIAAQTMPSLRIGHILDAADFELDYDPSRPDSIQLSRPDGEAVHPELRKVVGFWLQMLEIPASQASIQELQARPVQSSEPIEAMSAIYLLLTMRVMERLPDEFNWPSGQRAWADLEFIAREKGGRLLCDTEVCMNFTAGLQSRPDDRTLLLDRTSHYWSHFCNFAQPWLLDSGVTKLKMSLPVLHPSDPQLAGRLNYRELLQ